MEQTPQDKTKVRIFTDRFIIIGEIGMYSDNRLTDYIISTHEFIAITNARILTHEEKVLFHADFLDIQKNKIVFIVPESEITSA